MKKKRLPKPKRVPPQNLSSKLKITKALKFTYVDRGLWIKNLQRSNNFSAKEVLGFLID